ncbi:MAG: HsdR family type I site-specific deoxyribonuclease, partial [Bacteroidota bacterium]
KVSLSDAEFRQILNAVNRGNIFERAKLLRDRITYLSLDGKTKTVELINQLHWCQNEFQVTRQVTMEGRYKNRYDVTILINGLPLVQIELKRRGLELKEAFNQTNRYERHSYGSGHGLFQFIQLFVISNGVNTKYYANNPVRARTFKQTFYWTDDKNKLITQLVDFSDVFLTPCHLAKMITKYVVLNESQKILMVLRPYQYYATEAIIERVKNTTDFGYIWHTTGSGKTLTSFKTAQLLTQISKVHKVVFVVDRKDLDYQTAKEFNSFSKGSIDSTTNTKTLVAQLTGNNSLVVTTIQKLNTAIKKARYRRQMEGLRDKRIVFIFDECHRSQFGKTHHEIRQFFPVAQLFGFTGTPIFAKNAGTNEFGKRTTAMLFDKCLHKYVITDAIKDENVLKFSIEYISTFKKKAEIEDFKVADIDKAEVLSAPERLEKVVNYVIENHDRKTHQRKYTAIMCVSSVPMLIQYYRIFKALRDTGQHNLRVATIFSYTANEEDIEAVGDTFTDEEFVANDPYTLSLVQEA